MINRSNHQPTELKSIHWTRSVLDAKISVWLRDRLGYGKRLFQGG